MLEKQHVGVSLLLVGLYVISAQKQRKYWSTQETRDCNMDDQPWSYPAVQDILHEKVV